MNLILQGIAIGLLVGIMMTIQGIINTALANRVGAFGSVFIVAIINLLLVSLILIFLPKSFFLQNLPGWNRWYLYLGGVLGIFILTLTIFILPRLGAINGFIYIISGQLIAAVIVDHFGLLGIEKAPVSILKIAGIGLFLTGAYLVTLSRIKV